MHISIGNSAVITCHSVFDKSLRFSYVSRILQYVVRSILVVVVYVNKCVNDKMVEHVFALSGNY